VSRIFLCVFDSSLLRNVLDVNKHVSNTSHKANERPVAIVAETKTLFIVRQFPGGKHPVSSVSCEKPEASNGRTFVTWLEQVSKYR
jgi:hypothetical protein